MRKKIAAVVVGVLGLVSYETKAMWGGARLFRAEGEHNCWHERFIGYKCTNSGVNYTDCNAAFFALKNDNCCNRMYWKDKRLDGANSNGFKITKCTNWF